MAPDSWNRYEELVLHELRELREDHSKTAREVSQIRIDTEKLKMKSSIWGAVGGLLSGIAVALIAIFK